MIYVIWGDYYVNKRKTVKSEEKDNLSSKVLKKVKMEGADFVKSTLFIMTGGKKRKIGPSIGRFVSKKRREFPSYGFYFLIQLWK